MFYKMRWCIEVFYRSYKQTLQRRVLLSRTPATCLLESQWTLLGLWLLGLLCVGPQLSQNRTPRSCSVARARNAVRRAVRHAMRPRRNGQLHKQLLATVLDLYVRHGSKTARNYPRKKRDRPPGPPKIKPATPHQVRMAAELQLQIQHAV
jgi:hypothetical protein